MPRDDQPTGWTLDTLRIFLHSRDDDLRTYTDTQFTGLRDYHNQSLDAVRELLDQRYQMQSEALTKALSANDDRFRVAGEMHARIDMQLAATLTRAEYDSAHSRIIEQIRDLTSRVDREQGKDGGVQAVQARGIAIIATGCAILSVIVSIAALFAVFKF